MTTISTENTHNTTIARIIGGLFSFLMLFVVFQQFMDSPPQLPDDGIVQENLNHYEPVILLHANHQDNSANDPLQPTISVDYSKARQDKHIANRSNEMQKPQKVFVTDNTKIVDTQLVIAAQDNSGYNISKMNLSSIDLPETLAFNDYPSITSSNIEKPKEKSHLKSEVKTKVNSHPNETKKTVASKKPFNLVSLSTSSQKTSSQYAVQLGIFSKKENANKLLLKFKKLGYSPSILNVRKNFRVLLGPFEEQKAKEQVIYLKNLGHEATLFSYQ